MDLSPVTLKGRLVNLEPLEAAHAGELWEAGRDPSLWRWTLVSVRTREDMERYVRKALEKAGSGTALPFVHRDLRTGRIAGSTRFGSVEHHHRKVEIGWTWLGKAWQRTGINTEAKLLMLRHAFCGWDCVRVEFKTDVLNHTSRRAIERIGGVQEGVLRSHLITEEGRVRDTVYYSILAQEWPDVEGRLEGLLSGAGEMPTPAGSS
ncbi:MAG: GNAT family protein [Bacteroidota bacterium]